MNNLGTAIIAVNVDNMPVTASSPSAMSGTKVVLKKYFDIVDLGPVNGYWAFVLNVTDLIE